METRKYPLRLNRGKKQEVVKASVNKHGLEKMDFRIPPCPPKDAYPLPLSQGYTCYIRFDAESAKRALTDKDKLATINKVGITTRSLHVRDDGNQKALYEFPCSYVMSFDSEDMELNKKNAYAYENCLIGHEHLTGLNTKDVAHPVYECSKITEKFKRKVMEKVLDVLNGIGNQEHEESFICPECSKDVKRLSGYKFHYDSNHRLETDKYYHLYTCPRGDQCISILSNQRDAKGVCYETKDRGNFYTHSQSCNLILISDRAIPYTGQMKKRARQSQSA